MRTETESSETRVRPYRGQSQAPMSTESCPFEEKSQPVLRTRIRPQLRTEISISEAKCQGIVRQRPGHREDQSNGVERIGVSTQ